MITNVIFKFIQIKKKNFKHQTFVFLITFLFLGSFFLPVALPQKIDQTNELSLSSIDGQILFAPMNSYKTYLIYNTGVVNQTWNSNYFPGAGVRWLGDGTILRTIKTGMSGTGGSGGGIQKILWDGTITWDFRYDSNGKLTHHDVHPLPNGNVLMIAWETKTRDQAIAEGRNPGTIYGPIMPDHIIEVEPTGPTSGEIVWEWHVWDHLIQDFDSSKNNYGVVGNHPELVDINYVTNIMAGDWMHSNSIDYNEDFDQIVISVHNFNEIWVIDHSTTTEEATGHTGGNSGMGGDLLYRWGNPHAYDRGTPSDRKLFGQHDTSWIASGCPGEGNILIFNNGVGRGYSSVDEIVPPVDNNGNYELTPGEAYGPEELVWSYTGTPPSSFYANYVSSAERLTSGDTLICDGDHGKFFEVTPEKVKVWNYTNPYPSPGMNDIFKIVYIPPYQEPPVPNVPNLDCSGSLSWTSIVPGTTVNGIFQLQNIGDSGSFLNWTINISSIDWGTWSFNPGSGEKLTPEDGQVTVQVSVVAPNEENSEFEGFIRVENQENPEDFDFIPVILKTPKIKNIDRAMINQFLCKLINFYSERVKNLFFNLIYNSHELNNKLLQPLNLIFPISEITLQS